MATAEHREPCDSRGSCTVLGAPRGEIPPGDSTIATGRGKLQVQPCPQCSVSDGRPEKSGLSRWARSGTRPPVGGVYLAAGRDRLRSCRHVWRFMLPAADQAGNRRAEDGRKPEQPELRDVGSASKQRRTGASRRVDRSVGDRDQEQVNKR